MSRPIAGDGHPRPGHRPPARTAHVAGLATLGVVLALAGGLIALGLLGILPRTGPQMAIPPCDELPSTAEVGAALETRADFARALEDAGPDVEIRVDNPCEDDPSRAVVTVHYRTDEQWDAIQEVFTTFDALGVPARVVKD